MQMDCQSAIKYFTTRAQAEGQREPTYRRVAGLRPLPRHPGGKVVSFGPEFASGAQAGVLGMLCGQAAGEQPQEATAAAGEGVPTMPADTAGRVLLSYIGPC